jgi:hypothetical protein
MKKILLSTAAILTLSTSSAFAFSPEDDISNVTPYGICNVQQYASFTQGLAAMVLRDTSALEYVTNNEYWRNRNFENWINGPVTVELIAGCLETSPSNITNLVQSGATQGSTFEKETYMGFTYTLTQDTPHQMAGTYEYSVTGSDGTDVTAPTISLSAFSGPNDGVYTSQITLSEDSTDFDANDLTLTNATAVLSGTGSNYVATVTPLADGPFTLTVDAAKFTDSVGNQNTKGTLISAVRDNDGPVISAPQSAVTSTDTQTKTLDITNVGSATDSVDGSVDITYTVGTTAITGPYAFPLGVTTVAMNAIDSSGNSAKQVSFTVTVTDNGAPVITAPKNRTTDTDASKNTATLDVTTLGSATDSVDGKVAIIYKVGSTVLTGAYEFPIGDTKITMDAVDKNGNKAAQVSFTLTVEDTTAPTPPQTPKVVANQDGTLTISGVAEANTTLTVTFPDKTTDSVKSDATGLYSVTSKTAQPNGNISVTARDAAGNVSKAVLTTYTSADGIAPEQAVLLDMIVNPDSSITVIGQAEPGTTVEVVFPNGRIQSVKVKGNTAPNGAQILLLNILSDFKITSAPKQPSGMVDITVVDTSGNRSDVLSIAFNAIPTVDAIHSEIAGYMQARAGNIIAAQPDLIGLLSGNVAGAFNADVTKGLGNFEFSTNGKSNVWASVTGNWSETDGKDNSYYFGVVGAHTNVNPETLLGFMVQFDKLTQDNGTTTTKGSGFLMGPYFVAKMPNQPLYFEARLLKGTSDNTLSMEGVNKQDFTTHTTLVSGKVAGDLLYKTLTLTPSLSGTYLEDTQKAFTDTAGRTIEEQSITVKELALGLDASKPFILKDGEMVLTGGVSSIWSDTTGTGFASTLDSAYDGQRARLHVDSVYTGNNGISLSAGAYYDGIGAEDYDAFGLHVGLNKSF